MDIWSLSVVLEFQLCGRVDMKWRHSQRENSRTKGGGKRKGSTSSKTANWPLHVTFPRPVGPMDGLLWNGAVGYNLNIYLIISQQLQVKSSAFVGKERVMNEGSCVILVSYRAWTNWSPCATEKKRGRRRDAGRAETGEDGRLTMRAIKYNETRKADSRSFFNYNICNI